MSILKKYVAPCLIIGTFGGPLCANAPALSGTAHMKVTPLQSWCAPSIQKVLTRAKVLSMEPMGDFLRKKGKRVDFVGNVFLVHLEGGLKAVFKHVPDQDHGDACAEVAAYEASRFLGFPYIPPTVLRTIKGMRGSLQLYIETDVDTLVPEQYEKAIKSVPNEEIEKLRVFYFIFGQWDSGPHNMLFYNENGIRHVIAIDNSGIRQRQHVKYGDLPFVRVLWSDDFKTNDWNKPFPFEAAQTIQNPTKEILRITFGKTVPASWYKNLRLKGHPFRYVIYQNSLWRQYHYGDSKFEKPYTGELSHVTQQKLARLDMKVLQKIYSCAKGEDFLKPAYLTAILERRDQVLTHFKDHKST